MQEPLSLFFGCSFAQDRIGADGRPHDQGISDWRLAEIVMETIEAESQGRIKIVITKDPLRNYIPSKVREDLAGADVMLAFFTRRSEIPNSGFWMTSSYVVSEAAAYLMQLPSESETHHRLFALMEEGVDPSQLGMAFPPGTKTVLRFQRTDIAGLREQVGNLVSQILEKDIAPRDDLEYLALDKVVTILRDGRVQVETRHRFRFTKAMRKVVIPHSIWRVSEPLPNFDDLRAPHRDPKAGILKSLSLDCGQPRQKRCTLRIIPASFSSNSHEYHFRIEASGVEFKPGEEVEYWITWEYPHAFSATSRNPNSVGLRCGDRGIARHASLTLQFERDLDEPEHILEDPPEVSLTNVTEFRGGDDPVAFWHRSPSWKPLVVLTPCRKRSCPRYEVYHWRRDQFHGMAKVTFVPHVNYFQPYAHTVAGPANVPDAAVT